jgi:hypothetical protein
LRFRHLAREIFTASILLLKELFLELLRHIKDKKMYLVKQF